MVASESKITSQTTLESLSSRSFVIAKNDLAYKELKDQGFFDSFSFTLIPSNWLNNGELRLNAGYYSNDAIRASRVISSFGGEVSIIKDIAIKIFAAPISERHYNKYGTPYLVPSDVFYFRPNTNKYVTKSKLTSPELWEVKDGWILVSQSGSVGRISLATKRLEKYVVSQNLLRIVPKNDCLYGYVYAYLSTWVGQSLITKDQYGSAIKHIEPEHISQIEIPRLSKNSEETIHNEILKAYALREQANILLDKANGLLYYELGLPIFDDNKSTCSSTSKEDINSLFDFQSFTIKIHDIDERFDVSYHSPNVKVILEALRKCKFKPIKISDIVEDVMIPPRFKRIYVSDDHGVPFLQGAHLPLMKPYNLKHISNKNTKGIGRWIINKGWVLVTCSGTIGRTSLVTSVIDKWAASQHILRIIPKANRSHAGYLAAFLSTPYGQYQLKSKIYGGVIDEITVNDTKQIWIPDVPFDIQEKIGNLVVDAYEMKDKATIIEERAIKTLERILEDKLES